MICPNITNELVVREFNEIVEALGGTPLTTEEFKSSDLRSQRSGRNYAAMEAAYKIWHLNNGNAIDCAPNGALSKLFLSLLNIHNGDRVKAIKSKSKIYSKNFKEWFGDWETVNNFVTDLDTSKVEFEITSNKDEHEGNRTLKIYLKGQKDKGHFELVKDREFGQYSVHLKTDKSKLEKGDTKILFEELSKAIPEGAIVSTWGSLSEDGIRALSNNIGRGMTKIGERNAVRKSDKSNIKIPIFQKGNGVSKVVDENGEPLIVYRGTRPDSTVHTTGVFRSQIIFTTSHKTGASRYGDTVALFMNAKNPAIIDYKGEEYDKKIEDEFYSPGTGFTAIDRKVKSAIDKGYDALIVKNVKDGTNYPIDDYAVVNNNQIKSATKNNGNFSKTDNNINALKIDTSIFTNGNIESVFGDDIAQSLYSDEDVTSDIIMSYMLQSNVFTGQQLDIMRMLSGHKVPIIVDYNMTPNKIAETITDENGDSVIVINPNIMCLVTKQYAATAIMHEIIHAVTVNAIDHPETKEDFRFSRLNSKVFRTFRKLLPQNAALLSDVYSGLYAFSNEKEFAAVYMSDPIVRQLVRSMAHEADVLNNGKLKTLIKDFINSIVHLFSQKTPFKNNTQLLNEYQSNFENYLKGTPNRTVSDNSKMSDMIRAYKLINGSLFTTESAIDFFNRMDSYKNALRNNALMIGPLEISKRSSESLNYSYKQVADMLHTRLKALRASSRSQVKDKDRLIIETTGLIEMFTNKFTSKYSAISDLIKVVGPLIIQDTDELRSKYSNNLDVSGEEYMYQAHANIGMFEHLTTTLIVILNDDENVQQMIDFYNRDKSDNEKISLDDVEALKNNVNTLNGLCKEGQAVVKQVLNRLTGKTLQGIRDNIGASDLDSYINRLAAGDPILDDDISALETFIGAADSSASPMLKALAYILGKAKDAAEEESLEAMEPLLKASKGLNLTKIYEKADGKFTSYLVRRLNYGKFYIDYDKAMVLINKDISKKYGLSLSGDNRIAPQDNEEARIEWHIRRNTWLNDHAERSHNLRYYNAWAKLPEVAKQALTSYNNEISMILKNPKYISEDGKRVLYEKISEEDWARLQHLWTLRKLLRSDYDMFGNKKEEGSESYKIAQALRQLDVDLYGIDENGRINKPIPHKNELGWLDARNEVIQLCGGLEAYQKYIRGESNHGFDNKKFEHWDRRNSIRTLKRDLETGLISVFKKIDEEMRGLNVDFGEEYRKLQDQANELLKPFKDDRQQVIATELPETVKNLLLEIYHKQAAIKKNVLSKNKAAAKIYQRRSEIYKNYVTYVDTEYFKLIKSLIVDELMEDYEDFDEEMFNIMLSDYGTEIMDYETGDIIDIRPYRWLLTTEALSEEYMTYEPGNAWIEQHDDSRFNNEEFDRLSKEEGNQNVSMIPKLSLYANKQYDKLMSDSKYRKLYEETLKLNRAANSKQKNRQYTDDYLLPQISGTLGLRLKSAPRKRKISVFFDWIKEKLGFNYNPEDDSEYGTSFAADASTNEVDLMFDKHRNNLRGKYPDGRPFNMIPQYYTRRMKDPSIISTDLLDIMHQYYLMSASYELKSKVRGECDALLDMIQQRGFNDTNNDAVAGGENTDESNTYKFAKKFLEMNLYNVRRSEMSIKKLGVSLKYTKTMDLWREYATARNLGANPKVALVGMFTATYVHLINQIVGSIPGVHDKYTFDIGIKAFIEVAERIVFKNIAGLKYVGNKDSKDKMMKLVEFCDLSNLASRKFKYSDRNRGLGVVSNNYVFGFLSMTDFFVKSQIMVSEFMAYKYIDGEFMTKTDLYYNRHQLGEEYFKEKLKKFRKAPTLYSLLTVENKDGKDVISIDRQYRDAWNNVKYIAKSRAVKTAENADGMATQLQRNALSSNIIGALVLMHRQYLPLMLQETTGKTVYDYDTQRYKNGLFRSVFRLVADLMQGNLLAGIVSGGTVGYAFGGPVGLLLSVLIAPIMRAYGVRHGHAQHLGFRKCIKKYFSDFSSRDASHASYNNRSAIARTVVEILLFNLVTQPAITTICKAYDDDDRWYIQFLLYCLRAFAWEAYTKYRTAELFNNIRTAMAATSVTDGLMEIGGVLNQYIDPRTAGGNSDIMDIYEEVQKGAYKGWNKLERAAFEFTPWHNTYEQYKDPKTKRKYNETQIQKLPKSER